MSIPVRRSETAAPEVHTVSVEFLKGSGENAGDKSIWDWLDEPAK